MTTKMTERDKRLLYILCIALFIVIFVRFVFVPCMDRQGELEIELQTARDTQTQMETEIAALSWVDGAIEKNTAALRTANRALYDTLSNDELDDLVTGLVLSHDLVPMNLSIQTAAAKTIPAYFASSLAARLNASNTASSAPDTQADGAVSPIAAAATDYVLTATVTSSVTGTRENFLALLDTLKAQYPAIRVESFSLNNTAYVDSALQAQVSTNFNFTLFLYMCNKAGE